MGVAYGSSTIYQATKGIVQDGLVLNLDAGVKQSYDGGTTWRDLAGSNNGTFTNMDSSNLNKDRGGVLTFDGTDEYIVLDNDVTSIDCSFNTWLQTSGPDVVIFGGSSYSDGGYMLATSSSTFYFSAAGSFGNFNYNISNTLNTYKNLCVSRSGGTASLYVDGSFYSSVSITATNIVRCKGVAAYQAGQYPMPGRIGCLQFYNRALTATEVAQNFNVTRHRFGI